VATWEHVILYGPRHDPGEADLAFTGASSPGVVRPGPRRARGGPGCGGGGSRLLHLRVRDRFTEHRGLPVLRDRHRRGHRVAAPGCASGSAGGRSGDRRDGDPGRRAHQCRAECAVQREHRPVQQDAGYPLPAVRPLHARLCELRRRVRLLGHARRAACGRGSPPRTGDLGRRRRGGAGALNEMVEFLATLAHHGAHTGGYWNTGWDLVCNFTGAAVAGLVIARSRAGAASPAGTPA
jgi:hypothetical protein